MQIKVDENKRDEISKAERAEKEKNHKKTMNVTKGKKDMLMFLVTALLIVCLLLLNLYSTTRLSSINDSLQAQNDSLQEKIDQMEAEALAAATDTSFDYLAIGNSITQHPVYGDYWWGEWGMAASSEDKDYYHIVADKIANEKDEYTTQALNFTIWEEPFYEREDALKYLEGYVDETLDLVTIQLGENIYQDSSSDTETASKSKSSKSSSTSSATFEEKLADDYEDLIHYIKEKAPNAKILVIGEFWTDDTKDSAKQKACQETGATFVSLSEIQDLSYRVGTDTEVEGADGVMHTIEYQPVGEHPGDEAMAYIAEAIIKASGL